VIGSSGDFVIGASGHFQEREASFAESKAGASSRTHGYWTVTVRLTEVESPLALVAVTVTG
jgi:hypothetical protein